jgi:hypothetical protein
MWGELDPAVESKNMILWEGKLIFMAAQWLLFRWMGMKHWPSWKISPLGAL